jgi:hypothetical protein
MQLRSVFVLSENVVSLLMADAFVHCKSEISKTKLAVMVPLSDYYISPVFEIHPL